MDNSIVKPLGLNSINDILQSTADNSDYLTIDSQYLLPNIVYNFPIYTYLPSKDRYVLFKVEETSISKDQLSMLSKDGRRAVYVPKEYAIQVYFHLSQSLPAYVDDKNIPVEERATKINQLTHSVLKVIFEDKCDLNLFVNTIKSVSESLTNFMFDEPDAFLHLNRIRTHDYNTYSHSFNVCVLSTAILNEIEPNISKNDLNAFTEGVLLHDIGKCDIPHDILNKKGSLSDKEWDVVKEHPINGFEILLKDPSVSSASREIVLNHHEAIDGTGYPYGTRGTRIPLMARICKVVDVYDALTSRRAYKDRMQPFYALHLMANEMKAKLDQDILKQLIIHLEKMSKKKIRKKQDVGSNELVCASV